MGVCESATTKAVATTSAITSATSAISSITSLKNLISNNSSKFTEITTSSFDKYDKDKSGYIEQAELKEAINDMAKQLNQTVNIDEDVVKKALETLDTDKDGKISREEFTKLTQEKLLAL